VTIPAFPNYRPNLPAEQAISSRARLTQLGDGLIQERRWGLNPVRPTWDLPFELWPTGRAEVEAFLAARAADGQPFSWTAPGAAAATAWRCDRWTVDQFNGGRVMLQATFRRVFEVSPPELIAVPCGGNVITIITPPADQFMAAWLNGRELTAPDPLVPLPDDGYWAGDALYDAWQAAVGSAGEAAAWADWVAQYDADWLALATPNVVVGTSGETLQFSVSAVSSNASPLAYQWQVSLNDGASWANISNGAISATAVSGCSPTASTWDPGYSGEGVYFSSFTCSAATITATVSGATTNTLSITRVYALKEYLFGLMGYNGASYVFARVVVSSTGASPVTTAAASAMISPD